MNADRHHTYLMPTFANQRILRAIVDERRRALSRALHGQHRRPAIEHRLAELKKQAEAFHQQTIVLNAKLAALAEEPTFQTMRERLVENSAQIDQGLAEIVGDKPKS